MTTPNDKPDQRPTRGWWAPGKYICHCRICFEQFIGDKRASWCAVCAYATTDEELAAPAAPVATERPTPCPECNNLKRHRDGCKYGVLERQRDELAERLAGSEAGRVQAEKERDEANSRSERELEKLKVLFDGIEDSDPINDKLEKWQQNIEATLVADLATARTSAETSAAELQEARRERDEERKMRDSAEKAELERSAQLAALREERDKALLLHKECTEEAVEVGNHGKWESGVPDLFFNCTHGVFTIGGSSLCYTTSLVRSEYIVKELKAAHNLRADRDALAKALEIAERALVWARGVLWTNLAESLRNASADQWKVFTDAIAHVAAIRGGKQEGE